MFKEKVNSRFLQERLTSIKVTPLRSIDVLADSLDSVAMNEALQRESKNSLVDTFDSDEPLNVNYTTTILNDNLHKGFMAKVLSTYITYLKNTNSLNTHRNINKFVTLLQAQHATLAPFGGKRLTKNLKINNSHNQNNNIFKTFYPRNYPTNLKSVATTYRRRNRRGGKLKFSISLLRRLRKKSKLTNIPKQRFNITGETKHVSVLVKNFEKNYTEVLAKLNNKKKITV